MENGMRERRIHCQSRAGTFTHDLVDARGHRLVADEPVEDGGADLGTSPFELLASGLAVCTSITILVYVRQRSLSIDDVAVDVRYVRAGEDDRPASGPDLAERRITLIGTADPALLPRLARVARACPVHKLLEKAGVEVVDHVAWGASVTPAEALTAARGPT
jgi:putative redox protein